MNAFFSAAEKNQTNSFNLKLKNVLDFHFSIKNFATLVCSVPMWTRNHEFTFMTLKKWLASILYLTSDGEQNK